MQQMKEDEESAFAQFFIGKRNLPIHTLIIKEQGCNISIEEFCPT